MRHQSITALNVYHPNIDTQEAAAAKLRSSTTSANTILIYSPNKDSAKEENDYFVIAVTQPDNQIDYITGRLTNINTGEIEYVYNGAKKNAANVLSLLKDIQANAGIPYRTTETIPANYQSTANIGYKFTVPYSLKSFVDEFIRQVNQQRLVPNLIFPKNIFPNATHQRSFNHQPIQENDIKYIDGQRVVIELFPEQLQTDNTDDLSIPDDIYHHCNTTQGVSRLNIATKFIEITREAFDLAAKHATPIVLLRHCNEFELQNILLQAKRGPNVSSLKDICQKYIDMHAAFFSVGNTDKRKDLKNLIQSLLEELSQSTYKDPRLKATTEPLLLNFLTNFHANIDEKEANRILKDKAVGNFIIRSSSASGCFTISYKSRNKGVVSVRFKFTQGGIGYAQGDAQTLYKNINDILNSTSCFTEKLITDGYSEMSRADDLAEENAADDMPLLRYHHDLNI